LSSQYQCTKNFMLKEKLKLKKQLILGKFEMTQRSCSSRLYRSRPWFRLLFCNHHLFSVLHILWWLFLWQLLWSRSRFHFGTLFQYLLMCPHNLYRHQDGNPSILENERESKLREWLRRSWKCASSPFWWRFLFSCDGTK